MSWSLWGSVTVAVVTIIQKESYQDVVKCQAIMAVYVLSNLVKRQSIKYLWNVATQATFSEKKKNKKLVNSNQTTCRVVYFFLVL